MREIIVTVAEQGASPRELRFTKPIISIGRSSGCDIVLRDAAVSSRHARIRVYSDFAIVEDLKSTNGVQVDGQSVRSDVEIGAGSVLSIGGEQSIIRVVDGIPAVQGRTVAHVDEGKQRPKGRTIVAAAIAASGCLMTLVGVVATAVLGFLFWQLPSDKTISNLTDNERLSEAVGMVINGWQMKINGNTLYLNNGSGTGFAVSPHGHLITNNHVVEISKEETRDAAFAMLRSKGADIQHRLWVAFDGKLFDAKVVHKSRNQDMAILKVERKQPVVFQLRRYETPARGEEISALGYTGAARIPLSDDEARLKILEKALEKSAWKSDIRDFFDDKDFVFIMKRGIISSPVTEGGARWILHDATTGPGNSGSPICLEDGTVIGVHSRGSPDKVGNGYAFQIGQYENELRDFISDISWTY